MYERKHYIKISVECMKGSVHQNISWVYERSIFERKRVASSIKLSVWKEALQQNMSWVYERKRYIKISIELMKWSFTSKYNFECNAFFHTLNWYFDVKRFLSYIQMIVWCNAFYHTLNLYVDVTLFFIHSSILWYNASFHALS